MERKIHNKGASRLFKNNFLDRLARTSPTITLCTYVPIIALLLYWNFKNDYTTELHLIIPIYIAGIVSWTLMEYMVHRYLFHFKTDSPAIKKFLYVIHGIHHEYPRDVNRLFMPPLAGMIFILVFFSLFYPFMGTTVFVFLPGFVNGYLLYSFNHYFMHTRKPPKLLKSWWVHHSMHHYKHEDKVFGVSSPFWDHVFSTLPPKKATEEASTNFQ